MPDRLLNMRDRFVRGRLISPRDVGALLFEAIGAPPGVERIRVERDNFPPTMDPRKLRHESEVDLFLLGPTEQDRRMWYGHAAWAEQGGVRNPWIHQPPQKDDVVRGSVVAYVQEFACLVRLDQSGIVAFLHRDYLPDPPGERAALLPIAKQVFLGDRIEAVVNEARPAQLQLRLSVIEHLQGVRERLTRAQLANRVELASTASAQSRRPMHLGPARRILLIENDEILARSVQALAKHEGWHCDWARNEERTRQLLRQLEAYDAVLLDYHLRNKGQRLLCEKQLTGLRVALMSGDCDAAQHAREKGYSWLPKPVDWDLIHRFVQGTDLPPAQAHQHQDLERWSGGAAIGRQITRQYELLERLRQAIGALAVLWLLYERKDVYNLSASVGFPGTVQGDLDRLGPQWSQTMIADAHAQPETPHEQEVASSGPLKAVAPAAATHIVAIAANLSEDDGRDRRGSSILVFFRDKAWTNKDFDRLPFALWWAEDLADRLEMARRLEDQEAFATEGRLTAGLIHEIAQALSPLVSALQELDARMKKGTPTDAAGRSEEIDRLSVALSQAKRTSWLARNSLTAIQQERAPLFSIPGDIESFCKILMFVAGKRDITLQHDASTLPKITLRLPPAVIEQTLVNLTDNTMHHTANRRWANISIYAWWDDADALPLVIDFTDTGRGMTAEARSHLFEPRRSGRGRSGYGMGLYVSRNLLESIGGTLECVESLRWLGSQFRLRLPCQLADTET